MNVCNNASTLEYMGDSLGGVTFIASLWGGDGTNMEWLDGATGCAETCNLQSSSVTYTNFKLASIGYSPALDASSFLTAT